MITLRRNRPHHTDGPHAKLLAWTCRTTMVATMVIGVLAEATHAAPPNSLRYSDSRIVTTHAVPVAPKRPTKKPTSNRPSLVRQAAHGELSADVKQVGFLETHAGGCGPVCDCGGASCGMESVVVEPGCGIDSDGFALGCGIEASCGLETGLGPACGIESCPTCEGYADPACGTEFIASGCDGGPTCGCESCTPTSIPVFFPILRINWCRFDFFAGVQGFTGPMSFSDAANGNNNISDGSGSFGFYQGFNEGRSLRRWFGTDLSAQLGLRATQSNLQGAEFTNESRNQVFVTGGLFRRVDYGLQYGAVVDYLNDDWYFQGDLTQIRGEISWVTACHTFGFRYMGGLNDDDSTTNVVDNAGAAIQGNVSFEPLDQYRIFYRRSIAASGNWSGFLGGTDEGDFLLGGNMNLPLRSRLVLSTGFAYLAGDGGMDQHRDEAWNISLGLIYRPGGPRGCGPYCRPLFDVADNGSFFVRKK